jgi:hypothetical protein
MFNPALEHFHDEAAIIGRMVAGYGELELRVGICLGYALDNRDAALRTLFRILGESARIGAADALMRTRFKEIGIAPQYADAIGAVRWCLQIRNQYAHCQWGHDPSAGLFFTNLQEPSKASETFDFWWRHVDVSLLQLQESYFEYTRDCFLFLEDRFIMATKNARPPVAPMPPKRAQPKLHNPLDQHMPPWLAGVYRQRHIERAQEEKDDARSQRQKQKTPKLSAKQRRERAIKKH